MSYYAKRTYEGRVICDQQDLGAGYCGSASYEMHVSQLNDPDSWVHSSKERWLRAALAANKKRKMTIEDIT